MRQLYSSDHTPLMSKIKKSDPPTGEPFKYVKTMGAPFSGHLFNSAKKQHQTFGYFIFIINLLQVFASK